MDNGVLIEEDVKFAVLLFKVGVFITPMDTLTIHPNAQRGYSATGNFSAG